MNGVKKNWEHGTVWDSPLVVAHSSMVDCSAIQSGGLWIHMENADFPRQQISLVMICDSLGVFMDLQGGKFLRIVDWLKMKAVWLYSRKRTRTKRYYEESWQAGRHTPTTGIFKCNLAICLKRHMYNSCVLPAKTYNGAETWTLTKQAQNKLAAAQTKMERIERSILNISCKYRNTNIWVRKRTNVIYTIICLKSVCLSTFADCRSQFLLDRLGRCLKLIVSSGSTSCHEFASQFGLAFFLYAKNIHKLSRMPSLAHKWLLNEKGRNAGLAGDRSTVSSKHTRAFNGHSTDRLSQHDENNKSKRRQREFIHSRLENVV